MNHHDLFKVQIAHTEIQNDRIFDTAESSENQPTDERVCIRVQSLSMDPRYMDIHNHVPDTAHARALDYKEV